MITLERTAAIRPSMMSKALPSAYKIAAHLKAKHGVDFVVHLPIGGDPLRIMWKTEIDSLATFEALQPQLLKDEAYMRMLEELGGYMRSVHDEFWRSIRL